MSTKKKDGTGMKCWNCGKFHHLKDCPDCSDNNKQKTCENKKGEWSAKVKKGKPKSNLKKVSIDKAIAASNSCQSHMDDLSQHTEPNHHNGFAVVLDLGALDHMTGNLRPLTDVEEHFAPVLMPDDFVADSHKKGTMHIDIPSNNKGTESNNAPLLNTPLVPGLHSHMVSVLASNMNGTLAKFDTTHACLTVNGRTIATNDPCHQQSQS